MRLSPIVVKTVLKAKRQLIGYAVKLNKEMIMHRLGMMTPYRMMIRKTFESSSDWEQS